MSESSGGCCKTPTTKVHQIPRNIIVHLIFASLYIFKVTNLHATSKTPRYSCPDCETVGDPVLPELYSFVICAAYSHCVIFNLQWFENNPICKSREHHLKLTGHHKKPRPPSPDGLWDISFPESDNDDKEHMIVEPMTYMNDTP